MLGVVGLNHKTAPLSVREKLSFNDEDVQAIVNKFRKTENFLELVVLSTCNRIEFYYNFKNCCNNGCPAIIIKTIAEYTKTNVEDIKPFFYAHTYVDATRHLFRVASGLDSMVIGEYQIVNQIKTAFQFSLDNDMCGKKLTRLFNKALETSKKVRSQTSISEGPTSVSFVAVDKCQEIFPDLSNIKILLIGAGKTGELVIKKLVKKGCTNFTLANRTYETAIELAEKYDGKAIKFEEYENEFVNYDVVVTSTGSKNHIITRELVLEKLGTQNAKPIVFIDLSVPRNIDEQVVNIPNISLFNVDDLEEVVRENQSKKIALLGPAEEIIDCYVEEFHTWLDNQNLSPILKSIKNNFHNLNRAELAEFKKDKSETEIELIEAYAEHITKKLSTAFIKNLKEITENGKKTDYIQAMNDLFEISS